MDFRAFVRDTELLAFRNSFVKPKLKTIER